MDHPIDTRLKRLAGVLAVATGLVVTACNDSAMNPGEPLSLALTLNATGGDASAFDRTDAVAVVLRNGSSVVFDEVFPFTSTGRDASFRVNLDRSLTGIPLSVEVVLRWQAADLFFGAGTVTMRSGSPESVEITLQPVPSEILIADPPTLTVLGASVQLAAAAVFATGDTIRGLPLSWAVVDPDVVNVDANGVVTAVGEGEARVRASAGNLVGETLVRVRRAVESIRISETSLTLGTGASKPVEATPLAANGDVLAGRTVSWSSDDPAIAEVAAAGASSANGLTATAIVTGRAAGVTKIRASSEGREAVIDVTVVNAPVAMVPVAPIRAAIPVSGTATFTAGPLDDNGNALSGRSITWKSANPAIAEVSASGETVTVTGRGPGITTITATSEGRSGVVTVTVGPAGAPMAWVYADQPASPLYTPPGENLAGGPVTIQRGGPGFYTITFEDLGLDGLGSHFIAQVNAASPQPSEPVVSCHAYEMDVVVPLHLAVVCLDLQNRRPADGRFSAVIVGDNVLGGSGAPMQRSFFSLHHAIYATSPYPAHPDFSWNSAGKGMTVIPPGNYTVHRHGEVMRAPFAVFATQIQPAANECVVTVVSPVDVGVGCYSPSGVAANLPHKVLGFEKGRPGGSWGYLNHDPACVRPGPTSTTAELEPVAPASRSVLASLAGNRATEVEFLNDACEPVDLFWIDYSGNLQNFGRLQPGQSRVQGTFVTHPWLAIGLVSGDLAIFLPGPDRAVARIQPPTSSSGLVRFEKLGTGMSRVTFPGSSLSTVPAVLLTPRATGFATCDHRLTGLSPVAIEVACRGPGGQLEDHAFSLAYLH